MTLKKLRQMFSGFCSISGSPVRPNDHTRYLMTLDTVLSAQQTGHVYFCCWPCVCDTQDFLKVDTRSVTVRGGGTHTLQFLVIGNPCAEASRIPWEAPEVTCSANGELEGATLSDNGFVIVSMFFPEEVGRKSATSEARFAPHCEQRKQMDYNSGMGEIFRKVAAINPITTRSEKGEL